VTVYKKGKGKGKGRVLI